MIGILGPTGQIGTNLLPVLRLTGTVPTPSLSSWTTTFTCSHDLEGQPMSDVTLRGRTILMSGGSRGIGLAIALAAARQGANVALLAKTDLPDPRLPGTVHTAADEIEAVGGQALPIVGDVRDEESVAEAVTKTVDHFGGIDICVNNASAISLDGTEKLPTKRFDLMVAIELRGSYLLTRACLPHLRRSANPHILSMSPPLNMRQQWLGLAPAYMLAKYGMSLLTLGWAAEYADAGVAANCLWPETYIVTAAVENLLGGDDIVAKSRTPDVVADAAVQILTQPSRVCTSNTFIDAEVLRSAGAADLSKYSAGDTLEYDIFVDPPPLHAEGR